MNRTASPRGAPAVSATLATLTTLALGLTLATALPAQAFDPPSFDLQGHRGTRGLAPENTLPAFAAALTIGVSTLELDTGVTRDGVVVISHNPWPSPDIARGPDGQWLTEPGPPIHALDYAELAKYDVGRLNPARAYGHHYPEQKAVDGTHIPRLADLFALVKKSGNDTVRFNIETKIDPRAPQLTLAPEEFTHALLAAIRAAGMQRRVSIQSFDWRTLAIVQKQAPQIPTVYLSAQQPWLDNIGATGPAGSPWTAGIGYAQHGSVPKMVKAAGGAVWSPFYRDLDAAKLAEAHALGLTVVAWTLASPKDIAHMLDLGVDGIISDRPDLVRSEMQRRNMPLPPATPVTP